MKQAQSEDQPDEALQLSVDPVDVFKDYILVRNRLNKLRDSYALLDAVSGKLPSPDMVDEGCQSAYWSLLDQVLGKLKQTGSDIIIAERQIKGLKAYLMTELE